MLKNTKKIHLIEWEEKSSECGWKLWMKQTQPKVLDGGENNGRFESKI